MTSGANAFIVRKEVVSSYSARLHTIRQSRATETGFKVARTVRHHVTT